jgi:hypothetical protein
MKPGGKSIRGNLKSEVKSGRIAAFKMVRIFHLAFSVFVFLGACVSANAERCAVCGEEITGDTIYIIMDKVSNEKKHLCYNCSILPDQCFVCGMPVKRDYVKLADGRVICARDAKNSVLDAAEARHICEDVEDDLDRLFSRFTAFPTNINVAVVDRVNLMALFKVPGNDFDCPDVLGYFSPKTNHSRVRYEISLMSALPRAELKSTCAHELSHAWVAANVGQERRDNLSKDAEEGFCELVGYLLMESQNETGEMKAILHNGYTRGQIDLFIDAERTHGFNDVLDWMRWGTDAELDADDPNRITEVEMPRAKPVSVTNVLVYADRQVSVPDTLVLKGISGTKNHALILVNDQSLAVGESGKVRVGKTNILVQCLQIRGDSARIRIVGSGEERELSLQKPKQ